MPSETGQKARLPKRILLIDRDADLVKRVANAFQQQGYEVYTARDCQEGLQQMVHHSPTLVVLDLLLTNADGRKICQRLRETPSITILLAAQGTEEDIARWLDYGAADYLTKPFRIEELLARVRVLLRRSTLSKPADPPSYSDAYLTVDLTKRWVAVQGKVVSLTRHEYWLLACLVEDAGRVLTARHLLEKVWGWKHVDDVNYLRVYIWRLRQKIEKDAARPQYILTEHGVGYRFVKANP
jgi:two-component system KDP operon response regulator KdpE